MYDLTPSFKCDIEIYMTDDFEDMDFIYSSHEKFMLIPAKYRTNTTVGQMKDSMKVTGEYFKFKEQWCICFRIQYFDCSGRRASDLFVWTLAPTYWTYCSAHGEFFQFFIRTRRDYDGVYGVERGLAWPEPPWAELRYDMCVRYFYVCKHASHGAVGN
jgi:hypothetical protein